MEPVVEFLGDGDLVDPEVDHVEVVVEKDLCFVSSRHLHVVAPAGEVPFCLSHELHHRDLVQMDDVVRLVRELVCCLVGDQNSFDRVQVDKAQVLGQLRDVHLSKIALESNERVERLVSVLTIDSAHLQHLLDALDVG